MPQFEPIRILYMEDDVGLARLLQKKLERSGLYVVDLAQNGEEGLAMFDAGSYDVIAVDQKMPVRDGLEVIRTLASRGPLPPTIMVTGSGNEEIAIEAMKLGAGDYLVKDVDGGYLELLPSVIEQVLYQKRLVTEKQQAVAALQQTNRSLALLNFVGQQLAATRGLEPLMDLLLEAVAETVGAEGSSVWLIENEEEGDVICRAAFPHRIRRSPLNLRLRPGQGVAGWVIEKGEGVVISWAPDDPRFSPKIDRVIGFSTTSLLAVPLRVRGSVIGVLEVINKQNGQFNLDDRAFVETLAASAAIAIDNAQLVEALRQQTNELQARNEELDAFAHTVAHDLKTPLGPIIGLAQLLERYYDTMSQKEAHEILNTISRSGRKMNNIVNELLLLAKMHDVEVDLEPIEMGSIIAEVKERLAFIIEENQAEIIVPAQWPVAYGYGPWIEEVWANYISNAIKYGGKPPRLVLGCDVQPDNSIRFWVRDNGAGLTKEEEGQLFIPFTQLDKVRAEGYGLGLSIVRRIVERFGGDVGVESDGIEGNGCIFFFTLPGLTGAEVDLDVPEASLAA